MMFRLERKNAVNRQISREAWDWAQANADLHIVAGEGTERGVITTSTLYLSSIR
jgi:hypothetical protein